MKIYISYFYQIRFFKPYMIPLSTACFDPKWYYANQKQGYHWKDKNGVWNGLRAEPFMPGPMCEHDCRGPEYCDTNNPSTCAFLRHYRYQLNELDFNEIMARFEKLGKKIQEKEGFFEDPVLVLIVHEAPSNPCSERWVIKDWFAANGYDLQEWSKDI